MIALFPIFFRGGVIYGIDFAGGILIQVQFENNTNPKEIKQALKPLAMDDIRIQTFGKMYNNEFLIRLQNSKLDLEYFEKSIIALFKDSYIDNTFDIRRIETVGPKVGKDLRQKSFIAIFYSLLFMAIYISGRFEGKWLLAVMMTTILASFSFIIYWFLVDIIHLNEYFVIIIMIVICLFFTFLACWFLRLRYAMGVMVSLIHDILITVGFYTILGREFNLSTVAAVLTIIGYSINDTIIIYDRIRENLDKGLIKNINVIFNDSVNQTLSRTVLTVGTVLLVLFSLYFLGGNIIEDFALTMILGTLVGTYSSIYIATSVTLLMSEK